MAFSGSLIKSSGKCSKLCVNVTDSHKLLKQLIYIRHTFFDVLLHDTDNALDFVGFEISFFFLSYKTQFLPLLNKTSFVGFVFFPSPSPPPSSYALCVGVLIWFVGFLLLVVFWLFLVVVFFPISAT